MRARRRALRRRGQAAGVGWLDVLDGGHDGRSGLSVERSEAQTSSQGLGSPIHTVGGPRALPVFVYQCDDAATR